VISILWVHRVLTIERVHIFFGHALISLSVGFGFFDHLHARCHLLGSAARLRVELHGVFGKIAHHKIKYLVDEVDVEIFNFGSFENQLTICHERKQFAVNQHEVEIVCLLFARRAVFDKVFVRIDLRTESSDILQLFKLVVRLIVIVKQNFVLRL